MGTLCIKRSSLVCKIRLVVFLNANCYERYIEESMRDDGKSMRDTGW